MILFSHIKQHGVTLIEVIIAVTIVSILVIAVGFSITTYVDVRSQLLTNTQSLYLAEEGQEILRALRDEDWNTIGSLTVGDTYYLDVSANTLAIVSDTLEVIEGEYYRSFVINSVYRDGDDDITESTTAGAVLDPGTLEVTVSVSASTGTTSLTALLANIHAI